MPVLTHDRIKVVSPSGVLGKTGILYGQNALQSITVSRHTPHNPISAIGYLGIVDYTSGVVTSDVTLDCILVEGCDKADATNKTNSVNKYGAQSIMLGTEEYVLTSASLSFSAGNAATVNFGFLTGTIASYIDTQPEPTTVEEGEESQYAVVMGDDGSGIAIVPEWYSGANAIVATVPFIDSTGNLNTNSLSDGGLPAGVQSLTMNSNINRDQVLDVRVSGAIQFITTYPIDITVDMEMYDLPVASGTNKPGAVGYNANTFKHVLRKLKSLSVVAQNWGKHNSSGNADLATQGDVYTKVIGLMLNTESEAVNIGRYLMYTFNFNASDLLLPLPAVS